MASSQFLLRLILGGGGGRGRDFELVLDQPRSRGRRPGGPGPAELMKRTAAASAQLGLSPALGDQLWSQLGITADMD